MLNKYEHTKFIIERFDHYYDTVNSKGSFYIGINTFILGGICAGYITLYDKMHAPISLWLWVFLFLLFVFCISSTLCTIRAITPYSKDNHSGINKPSLMYFGGIAKHELCYFKEKFNEQDDQATLNDVIQQAHSLAKGLEKKFKYLKWASYFLTTQYCIMLPVLYLIFKNFS